MKKIIKRFIYSLIIAMGIIFLWQWISTINPSIDSLLIAALDIGLILSGICLSFIHLSYYSEYQIRSGKHFESLFHDRIKDIFVGWLMAAFGIMLLWIVGRFTLWVFNIMPSRFEITVIFGIMSIIIALELYFLISLICRIKKQHWLTILHQIWKLIYLWIIPFALAIGLVIVFYLNF